MKKLDGKTFTSGYLKFFEQSGFQDNYPYKFIFYIDLNEKLATPDGERTGDPFVSYGDPYTIDVTLRVHTDSTDTYFNKSRVYFSIGQNVPGVGGNIITVGTNASSSFKKKKPCIGVLTKDGYKKALATVDAIELEDGEKYNFKLIFNPAAEKEQKLILFMTKLTNGKDLEGNDIHVDDPIEVVQSIGTPDLSSTYNFEVTTPRLYFYSSGWTNEEGWVNTYQDSEYGNVYRKDKLYDYAYATISEYNELDYTGENYDLRPIKVTNKAVYPDGFLLESLKNIQFEFGPLIHKNNQLQENLKSVPNEEQYGSGSAGSTVVVYI